MLKNIFWINNESIKFGQGIWPNLGNLSTKGMLRVKNKSNIVRNDVSVYLIDPWLLMRKTLERCGMRKWRTENKVILPGFWTCSCDLNSSSHPNFSYICWSPSVILGSWWKHIFFPQRSGTSEGLFLPHLCSLEAKMFGSVGSEQA